MPPKSRAVISLVILLAAALAGGALIGGHTISRASQPLPANATPDVAETVQAGIAGTTTVQQVRARMSTSVAMATVVVSIVPPMRALDTPAPTMTAGPVATEAPTSAPPIAAFDRDLGVCPNCAPPATVGANQVVLVHGDIDTSGTCHYRVFTTGQSLPPLGTGQYRVKLIQGSATYIDQRIASDVAGAAATAGGSCPKL